MVFLAAVALYGGTRLLPVREYLETMLEWTGDLKERHLLLAMVLVVAAYVVSCVLMLPGSVLTIGAGIVFGLALGVVTVSAGSTLGACVAFLVGRTIARDWVARRVADNPKWRAIDEAVGRQGFKIVLLTRLSPVFPFNLQNYGYGLTAVSFWKHALASWVGMMPGTVMYVYIGTGVGSLARLAAGEIKRTAAQRIAFWVGLVIAVGVALFVARIATRALRREVGEESTQEGNTDG